MKITPELLPAIIEQVEQIIADNADEVTALDQDIGDGDHVYNLQRGLDALNGISSELASMEWAAAFQKIGMTLMSTVGGASGSLYGSFFITMSKSAKDKTMDYQVFAAAYLEGVESIKKRGKADVGEKTMLDVLVPVAQALQADSGDDLDVVFGKVNQVAAQGVEATRDMLATKGRASFLGERTIGHIDAGAKTAQLMIQAITGAILTE